MGPRRTRISDQGVAFVIRHEGVVLHAYDDLGPGKGNCTIGVGHLLHRGPCSPVELERTIGLVEAHELLLEDLRGYEQAVVELIRPLWRQSRFDALVDFTFNVGIGALESSTLRKVINARGSAEAVCREFERWVFSGGVKLPGMIRRREDECRLWRSGRYM